MDSTNRALVSVREHREHIIARLSEAFARDVLDVEEFERRLSLAHGAESVEALDALVAEMPTISRPERPIRTESIVVRRPDNERPSQTLAAILSGVDRRGSWQPARHMRVISVMGGAQLDFREAQFLPGVTTLRVVALMGGVDIIVPPGLAVEMDGVSIMGGFEHLARSPQDPEKESPLLRISGLTLMGGVSIRTRLVGETERNARRREKAERKALRAAAAENQRDDTKRKRLNGRPAGDS